MQIKVREDKRNNPMPVASFYVDYAKMKNISETEALWKLGQMNRIEKLNAGLETKNWRLNHEQN